MQPSQARPAGNQGSGSNQTLKRWGPIIGIAAVVAVVIGIVVASSGGDDRRVTDASVAVTDPIPVATDNSVAPTTPTQTQPISSDQSSPDPTQPGIAAAPEVTFPMSFSRAIEEGIEDQIDWGPRCDTATGRVAVPSFFAPVCMAPFSGDNGGATSTGVTADEITIVYYEGQANDPIIAYVTDAIAVDDTNSQQFDTMREFIRYYETYVEMYGRTINLITFEGTGNATDDVAARADAARIAAEYQPFVVFGGPALTSAFADELAANEIMCIGCTPGQPTQFYVDRDPYVWALDGSQAQKQVHVAEFIGKQLVGGTAEFAGDDFIDTPRTFGLLYLESSAASKDLADQFTEQMSDVGAPFAEVVAYALDPTTIQATASQAISKLKSAGVTTIVFAGDPVAPRDFTNEATAQEYFPEWVIAASTLVDLNAFARTYDQQQWAHAFGVTSLAARTDGTKIGAYAIYEWFTGSVPPADETIGGIQPNPALFFAVLQAVGPNLTHQAWKDALFALPPTAAAISQPSLSWGERLWPESDYNGIDDATVFWWDATATGPDELNRDGTGMYQFVDGGTRYLPGAWPTDNKLFDPAGAVTIYTTPPPGEEAIDYPRPTR